MTIRHVYYAVKDGQVVGLFADIGPAIADDIAEAIREGAAIQRAPLDEAPSLFAKAPAPPEETNRLLRWQIRDLEAALAEAKAQKASAEDRAEFHAQEHARLSGLIGASGGDATFEGPLSAEESADVVRTVRAGGIATISLSFGGEDGE